MIGDTGRGIEQLLSLQLVVDAVIGVVDNAMVGELNAIGIGLAAGW